MIYVNWAGSWFAIAPTLCECAGTGQVNGIPASCTKWQGTDARHGSCPGHIHAGHGALQAYSLNVTVMLVLAGFELGIGYESEPRRRHLSHAQAASDRADPLLARPHPGNRSAALEGRTCECYAVVTKEYDRLVPAIQAI